MYDVTGTSSWEVVGIALWHASGILLLVALPVAIGGLVWWQRREEPPSNWFVRGCMLIALVIPVAWLVAADVYSLLS